jgi:hypothetical protein
MTLMRIIIALVLSVLCTESALSQKLWDPGVNHWIGYMIIGPMNHPFPVVYIVRQNIKIPWPEFLTVLPQRPYQTVSAFTRAQMGRSECLRGVPPDWRLYEVKIFVHTPKGTRTCILPIATGRNYLAGVIGLRNISWSEKELRPINYFMDEVQSIIRRTSADKKQGGQSR